MINLKAVTSALVALPLVSGLARHGDGLPVANSPYRVPSASNPVAATTSAMFPRDVEAFGLGEFLSSVDSTMPITTTRSTNETTLTCSVFENGVRECSVVAGQSGTCSTEAGFNGQQCSAWTTYYRDAQCSVIGNHGSTHQCSAFGESGAGQPMVCSVIGAQQAGGQCSVLGGGSRNAGKCSVFSDSATTTQRCSVTASSTTVKCSVEAGTKGTCTVVNGNTATSTCSVQGTSKGSCSVIHPSRVDQPTNGKCSGS